MNTLLQPLSASSSPEYLPLYRPSRELSGSALALFALLACLLFTPHLDRLTTEILGGPRSLSDAWVIRSNVRDILSLPWLDTRASYPLSGALAWGDNLIVPSILLSPLISNGVTPVVACNLLLFLFVVLNGWCAFRLIYQLTGTTSAALLGGATFMTAPIFWGPLAAPSFNCIFLLPLAVSATLRLVATPQLRSGLVLGVYYSIAAFTSSALVVVTVVSSAILIASFLALHPHRWPPRVMGKPFLGILLGVLPTLAIIVPLATAREILEPLSTQLLHSRSATLASFAPLHPLHLVSIDGRLPHRDDFSMGWLVFIAAFFAVRRLADSGSLLARLLFTGVCVAAAGTLGSLGGFSIGSLLGWFAILGCAAIIYRLGQLERKLDVAIVTNRALIAAFLFLGVFFLLFALGPAEAPPSRLSVPSVFSLTLALFGNLFVIDLPVIGGAAVVLALSIIGAFTVARTVRNFPRALFMVPIIGLLLILENYRFGPSTTLSPPTNIERYLEMSESGDNAIIALPLPEPGSSSGAFLNSIFPAKLLSPNGHTDRQSRFLSELGADVRDFPSARSIRALAAIGGLRYIVATDTSGVPGAIVAAAEHFADSIRYLDSDGAGRYLFEFTPETRIRADFRLFVPARPTGILRAELQALYETGEPEIPIILEWNDGGEWKRFSEAVVTANGEWAAYSFPLPEHRSSPEPFEVRFITPGGSRVAVRRTGFTPHR